MKYLLRAICVTAGVMLVGAFSGTDAAATCTFTDDGVSTLTLDADCTTDETISIPDGYTLDGAGHSITAIDPVGDRFIEAIIKNEGATAYVKNIVVQAQNLNNICAPDPDENPDTRLRGIMFEGASGAIWQTTVQGINKGASGCQEGNAIEIRNAPFDGTHPGTQTVEISHNVVEDYQKGGIICNGDVVCSIHHNFVGDSATQQNLAANSVQFGFGAGGELRMNHITGNQWLGVSNYVATAVLVYQSAVGLVISRNNIGGNSDVGIYANGNEMVIDNNRIFDGGDDGNQNGHDWGLGNWGSNNEVTNNKVRGFDIPVSGDTSGTKIIPSPSNNEVCFGADCDGA